MKQNLMHTVSDLPFNLCAAFAETIATQADQFGIPTIGRIQLNQQLLNADDLTRFDQMTLEDQRQLYNVDHLAREAKPLLRWAERLVLRGGDKSAREAMKDRLGIVYLEETIDCLLRLNKRDPHLVTLLLEGRIGSAIHHVPEPGYRADIDEDSWPVKRVMGVIAEVLRLWIANDLQLEAAATHVRIFRPTGCDILDRVANGWPVTQATVISRIEENLKLYNEIARLYFGETASPRAAPFAALVKSSVGHLTIRGGSNTHRLGSFIGSAAAAPSLGSGLDRNERWTAICRHYGRDATQKEVAFVPHDLRQKAERMLQIWRREHGDELEHMISFRMNDARWRMKRLQTDLGGIKSDPKLKQQRAHEQKGLAPLTRLWIACLNAVLWTDWIRDPKAGHSNTGAVTDIKRPDFVEEAVLATRRAEQPKLPKLGDHHRAVARELFFLLRCTIVRDPEHLPRKLLEVRSEAGLSVEVKSRSDAELQRGRPYRFGQIYAVVRKRLKGSTRNSKEVLSHGFVGPANRFLKEHAKTKTAEGFRILEQAAGTAAWRLTQ